MARARRFHCENCNALKPARELVYVVPDPKRAYAQVLCPECAPAYEGFLDAFEISYGTVKSGPLPPVPKGTVEE